MGSCKGKQAKKARKAAEARAEDLVARARDAWDDAEVEARAQELVKVVRDSDAYAAASDRTKELAELAREAWKDSDLDDKAEALVKRVRSSKAGKRAVKQAEHARKVARKEGDKVAKTARKEGKRTAKVARKEGKKAAKVAQARTDEGLEAFGEWLGSGESAKKLGVRQRRRWPSVLLLLAGVIAGFAAARLLDRETDDQVRDELAAAADRLASQGDTSSVLADTIRTTLDADPRTAELQDVEINVSDGGTVFVRGTVPAEVDQEAVRDVVASVPGVTDVDLQLSTASQS